MAGTAALRFHVHHTPTYAYWLNQMERWFWIITQKAIGRGSFSSVKELIARIEQFVETCEKINAPQVACNGRFNPGQAPEPLIANLGDSTLGVFILVRLHSAMLVSTLMFRVRLAMIFEFLNISACLSGLPQSVVRDPELDSRHLSFVVGRTIAELSHRRACRS